MKIKIALPLLFFLCCTFKSYAQSPYWFSVGEEVFHFRRVRDGGTWQDGRVDGIRVGFDRIKRYGWYLGADYLFASGTLRGETATGRKLRSRLTDHIVEVRLGFTLQQSPPDCPFFTPFAGWGYFREINDFLFPSPIPVKFTDTFNYITIGFLSGRQFTPLLAAGFNFKLKFMQDAKSQVTNDPLFEDVTLLIKNEIQVRVDFPITFCPCGPQRGVCFEASPFYEFRHFGGREGFPFNFRDTKFYLFGAKLALLYRF